MCSFEISQRIQGTSPLGPPLFRGERRWQAATQSSVRTDDIHLFLWFVGTPARFNKAAPQSLILWVVHFMLCDPQASGLLRSNLKSAVYIPFWPLSNIVFLITNDAAISDKQKRDKHRLLSVISRSRCQKQRLPLHRSSFRLFLPIPC